ncbi:hypothetical protein HK099_000872, partial [Clydaea vesicula]
MFWVPYFASNVTAIIFIAAISSYDQFMEEEPETNRLVDSLKLFTDVCNHKLLKESSMILFLNKYDLFIQKITYSSINKYFPEFN